MTRHFLLHALSRLAYMAMLRAGRRTWAMLALMLLGGAAHAASLNFNGSTITGCSLSPAKVYTCATLPLVAYDDSTVIASSYTVVVSSDINFGYSQSLQMSGSARLQSSGVLNIGDINGSLLNITGGTLVAGTTFKIGAQVQTITADVSAVNMTIGTGSNTRINGTLTATGQIDLASHATIVGPITAPTVTTGSPVSITGNVSASTSFTLSSGSTVTGNVSGGDFTIQPSGVVVTGNVNISGSLVIGSGDTVNGDVAASNVTTQDSNGYISGNAAVNAITLGYAGKVGKTITCTGSGASGCSCVTNNSGYGMPAPVCGPAAPPAPTGPDHILITHSGSALTCQPQTVSLTACANAACSSNYSGSVTATLAPGGQSVTFNGTGSGTVSQSALGTATLAASGTGIGGASTCVNNTSNTSSCSMTFADVGLDLQVSDHVAETQPTTLLRVLKQSTTSAACVSALANTDQTVSFKCAYVNPSSGTLPVRFIINNYTYPLAANATSSCSSGTTNVTVHFDATGQASPALLYADVGAVTLSASMKLNGTGTALSASATFTAAPSAFVVTAFTASLTNPAASSGSGSAFTAAGSPFTVKITPVNAAGATTSNFGHESTPESPKWSGSLLAPSGGHYPGLVPATPAAAALTTTAATATSPAQIAGASTTSGVIFEEVGVLKLDASLSNTNGYLNKASFLPVGTLNIGRFYPDHFNTVLLNTSSLMSCASNVTCPVNYNAGAGFMAYSKQPFDISVTAYSANNVLTQNYTNSLNPGGFSRAVTISAVDAASNLSNPPASPSGNAMSWKSTAGVSSTTDFPAIRFLAGVANSTASGSNSHPEYDFGSSYINTAPATAVPAPTTIALRATESSGGDGVTSLRATAGATTEATLSILSGRLQVVNNYGSTTLKMPIKVRAQYWNGTGWVLNPQFPGQTVALGSTVTISNCLLKGGASATCPTLVTSPTQSLIFGNASDGAGNASFYLNPMNPAGSADLLVSPLIYLPSTLGRATFGVYRSGPLIYIREVF